MSGMALTRVAENNAYRDPNAPRTIACAAAPACAPATVRKTKNAPTVTVTPAITIVDLRNRPSDRPGPVVIIP
jgi:hypothetical protein